MIKKHVLFVFIILLLCSFLVVGLNKLDNVIEMPLVKVSEYLNENYQEAKEFDKLVSELPNPVSLSDKELVQQLLDQYDGFSEETKQKVTSLATLQAASNEITQQEDNKKAQYVMDLINNLANSNNPELVAQAMEQYNLLTDKQKELVTNLFILEQAQEVLNKEVTNENLNIGDIVVFKGGYVYNSSKSQKPANKQGYSVCKVTYKAKDALHPYHLVSTDGKSVYGWVNVSDIAFME